MNQPFLLVFLNSSYVQNIPFSCLYLCQQPAVFYMFNSWTDNLSLTNLRFKRKVKHLDDGPDQGFRLSSCDYTCFFPPLFFFFHQSKKKKITCCLFSFLLPVSTTAVTARKQENTRCCSATFPTLNLSTSQLRVFWC